MNIIIRHKEYEVLGVIYIDPEKYPKYARFLSGHVYIRPGKRGNVYSVPLTLDGKIRTDLKPANCGQWSAADIRKLEKFGE